ncbi:MAG: DEAD/DEAH box helicase family protein [Candidatus Omnitrophota bacterium]
MTINEAQTRKQYIDEALKQSGWNAIVPYKEGVFYFNEVVEEYPTASGPADYVLFSEGKPIAVVEGKKVAVNPQNVLQQAQRYSRDYQNSSFSFNEYKVPFCFSTNGKVIWYQDVRHPLNRSREIAQFFTPQALEELLKKDEVTANAWISQNDIDDKYLRGYQIEAISAIEKAVTDRRRKMLVAMATGTGKTFTTVNLIYRMIKSGHAKRILFLVDRKALAAQAVSAFASFEPEPGLKFDKIYEVYSQKFKREDFDENESFNPKVLPNEYLTDPKDRDSFVYVCTIQRMRINLFGKEGMFDTREDDDADKINIPIHAFDLIIADECHRGYTSSEESKWREVLTHFDAIKVGLTATPAAHTTAFFKHIAYRYDYERAVREGYLVDYDAIKINSEITINGVFLNEGEEVGVKDTETGQLTFDILEDERELSATANENDWTAPARNRSVVQEIKRYLDAQENDKGHFPKTLIFAHNDLPHRSHCDQLVEILRDEFSRGDAFVQKITGSPTVDRPLQRIREFRNRQNPGIVVTVDMLSTGVDVPKIENIVFLRPVKSRILFEQMMGRGTRLCDEINKDRFTVFDCFNGTLLEYFRKITGITAEAPAKPTKKIREIVNDIKNNVDRSYNVKILSKRLQRISKVITHESRQSFNFILEGTDIADFARDLPQMLESDWANTMRILQKEAFFDICDNYKRARKTFIIADGAEDTVTSERVFRAKDGSELRPTDYIKEFEQFVKDNPEHIEALEILLNRPKEFHTSELEDLRGKLSIYPNDLEDKFTEKNLRDAYDKKLADIISIIKHAAQGEDLLTAESRIKRAFQKIRSRHKFTEEQEKWLTLIEGHLVENILMEKEDFDLMMFTREGGNYSKINQIFNGELDMLIQEINEAVLR